MHHSAAPFNRLIRRIDGEVHTDAIRRHLLSTDGSIFQIRPAAVVYPKSAADVQQVVRFADRHGLSVHARGAGSGLCGASLGDGIVLDFTKFMHRLLHLDPARGWFACEPGYRYGELAVDLKGTGLFFPPDPSSGEYATFGGMCATNASGAHSVKYGNTADYLLDADVVFADGSLMRLSGIAALPPEQLPKNLHQLAGLYSGHAEAIENAYPPVACNVAGYNLKGLVRKNRLHLHRLLAGSEGTLGVATRLRFRLNPRPACDALVVAYFDDIVQAARATQLAMTMDPAGIEIMDKSLLQLARDNDPVLAERIPRGFDNVLLIEFDGDTEDACRQSAENIRRELAAEGLSSNAYPAVSVLEKERFWAVRKAAVPILYRLKGRKKILALVEDAAVPVDRLVPFFRGLYAIFNRHQVDFVLYGHIAKGLLHTRPLLDLKDPGDVALLQVLADAVFDLVSGLDGTVSGEHGDGRLRTAYVKRRYPHIYPLMQQAKALLDPQGMFNPEIITQDHASQMESDLRYGSGYANRSLGADHLSWTPSLMDVAEQCHGCSKCTTVTDDTRMCPVYKVTRDENASPKAKANVLRALISGDMDHRMLFESRLQQVMDRCVNCGSCFLECPSNVNIPKLAMEAKARFVKRFGAPLRHYLTAHVETAARWLHPLAGIMAPLARNPMVHQGATRLTGLASQRPLVTFARHSFYRQYPRLILGEGPRVLFFAGCYAAYIRPELAEAAVSVFKRMGLQIHVPPQVCCGLPHLSKGMVPAARRKVQQNLAAWGGLLPEVDYVVVTCSSCGYALMQDWAYLTTSDAVRRLKDKIIHVSQLLLDHNEKLMPGPLPEKMAYHQPCHLRLQSQADSSARLLATLPEAHIHELGSHCCGMAGSWGMLSENFDLSKAIGTPMINELQQSAADCGVTDCPTCQMQMEHLAGPLGGPPIRHPIEMVWQSIQGG